MNAVEKAESVNAGRWWALYLCFLAVVPALFTSLVFPRGLGSLGTVFSVFLAYRLFKGVQDKLFSLPPPAAHFYLNVPLYFLILVWAWALITLGRPELVSRAVGPSFLLLVVLIWPVYRFRNSRQERRVPLSSVYPVFAGVILVHQGFLFVREVCSWFGYFF